MRHFLKISDLSHEEFLYLLKRTRQIKNSFKSHQKLKNLLDHTLVMIFEKQSTRTRLSFEAGIGQMGGRAIYLNTRDTQLGRGETIEDAAKVISRMCSLVMIRTFMIVIHLHGLWLRKIRIKLEVDFNFEFWLAH